MEDRHNHNHPPSNGFLMGIIVGSVATLLFTTKKGREIVNDLADKGLEKFTDIQKKIESTDIGPEEVMEGDDYIEPAEVDKIKLAKEEKPDKDKIPTPPKPHRVVKRFFRLKKN